MLNLLYITNRPEVAVIAEDAGVNTVFVDLETIGKSERQGGLDTVQSHHTIEDIVRIRRALRKADLLVRCNQLYDGSQSEIDSICDAGADIIMLPYFKEVETARRFIEMVDGRARTCLLIETAEAARDAEKFAVLPGVDMVHIGLNDLHLDLGMTFMFQLLADGTVERLGRIFDSHGLPWGFGGVARLGYGDLPAEAIITEHYRLGSRAAIVSRSFCNTDIITDLGEVKRIFDIGIADIRDLESRLSRGEIDFEKNRRNVVEAVERIVFKIQSKK